MSRFSSSRGVDGPLGSDVRPGFNAVRAHAQFTTVAAGNRLVAVWLVAIVGFMVGHGSTMAQEMTPATSSDDRVRFYRDSNGITWREERSTVRQPLREVQLEPRQQQVYREQYRTQTQQHQYLSYSPVVQYEWVPRLHDWWRIFREPYVAYHLEPQVRWQTRPYTVQVPVAQRELVAESRTVHVPVARLKFEDREQVTRTAMGAGQPALAQQVPSPGFDPYEWNRGIAGLPSPTSVNGAARFNPTNGPSTVYGGIARMDDGLPRVGTAPTRNRVR